MDELIHLNSIMIRSGYIVFNVTLREIPKANSRWAETCNCDIASDWPNVWAELPRLISDVRLPTIGHNLVPINRLCNIIV